MRDLLTAMIKAHEIQGILALENSLKQGWLGPCALCESCISCGNNGDAGWHRGRDYQRRFQCLCRWGQPTRLSPSTEHRSRKSWAAGDATSRAVWLALMAMKGEMGYPSVLSAEGWGFYDVQFKGKPFVCRQPYGAYVMENVLFKIAFPAEFHAQTAVECAFQLHESVKDRLDEIDEIQSQHMSPRFALFKNGTAAQSRRSRSLSPIHDSDWTDPRNAHR